MEIKKLTEEVKRKIYEFTGLLNIVGSIQFFNKEELVGWCQLPEMSMMETRHMLAEFCRVSQYDNFKLLKSNGDLKADAKDVFMTLGATLEDYGDKSIGEIEGIKYQFFKNKHTCSACGRNYYKADFPEQKELVDELYKK